MSATRHAEAGAPLSQERYMSALEYQQMRGISGTAVAEKVFYLGNDARKRELLLFIQGLSLERGGVMENVAKPLLQFSLGNASRLTLDQLEARLVGYCIDPGIERSERWLLDCLKVEGALFEFKQMHERHIREQFIETSVAAAIKETFDKARRRAKLYALEAAEGVGKSETARVLCAMYPGVFRFIDLKGACSKKEIFRIIAKALGLASSDTRKQADMKVRVQEFIRKTGIILVIDEAHHMLPSGERIYVQPEMINWLYTMTNYGVAAVLITTSVFSTRLRSMSRQIVWNIGQVERRMEYRTLPFPTRADMEAIAKCHPQMKGASAAAAVDVAGYAMDSPYPLTALVDAILDAREIAQRDGRERITYDDMRAAITALEPLDKARDVAFHKVDPSRGRKRFKPPFKAPERGIPAPVQDDDLAEDRMTSASRLAGNPQRA